MKIEYEKWFTGISDVQRDDGKPITVRNAEAIRVLFDTLVRDLTNASQERIYTGRICGSRASRIKKAIKNVFYWFHQVEHSVNAVYCFNSPHMVVTAIKQGIDSYGNVYKHFNVDFSKYYFRNYWPCVTGRMHVQLEAHLKNTLRDTPFRRWMFDHFPRVMNKLKDRFESYFEVTARCWLDIHHYVDITCYQIKLLDKLVVGREPSIDQLKKEKDERYRQFGSQSGISNL